MVYVPPISQAEFLQLLQRCIPPTGWPQRIAVANSGGPDSTCLLFLLSSLIRVKRHTAGLPQSVVSIHVNHKLQDSADDMAKHAEDTAIRLGVPHLTTDVHWGVHPFPPKPRGKIENSARRARLNRLFDAMKIMRARVIAFGHHADDQVETAVLRLAMGSGPLGASGMAHMRRWGMGGPTELEFCGYEGMRKYMVRPLLDVSKDRILATCEANKLDYIVDSTNFEPAVAFRNSVRSILAEKVAYPYAVRTDPEGSPSAPVVEHEARFRKVINDLGKEALYTQGKEALYKSVQRIGDKVEALGVRVTKILKRIGRPSPPSTVLICTDDLRKIEDMEVAISLVRRIMRYASPYPFGHISAEAKGQRSNFEALINKVWNNADSDNYRAWCFGSGVLWTPVTITAEGMTRFRKPNSPDEESAWLISREPPASPRKRVNKGILHCLDMDVTSVLRKHLDSKRPVDILYDCRFLVSFYVERMPAAIRSVLSDPSQGGSIVITRHSSFFLPKVSMRYESAEEELVLAVLDWKEDIPWRHFIWRRALRDWIQVRSIRTLSHT